MEGTSYIISIVDQILRRWGVRVDKKFVNRILCSDPSYPSIKSLHDTFAYYGLKSNVYQADFEHIIDHPYCVVHSNKGDGHFFLVKEINEEGVSLYDGKKYMLTREAFMNIWDGAVLLIEEKEVDYATSRFNKIWLFLPLIALLYITQIPVLINSFDTVVQYILDAVGLLISYLLYSQSLFTYKNLPFCHMGERFDCSAVSKVSPFNQFIPFGLPIVGITFFVFDFFLLFLGSLQNMYVLCIYALAAVCMFLLIVYQFLFIRRYCLYCIFVSIIVFLKPFFICAEGNFDTMALLRVFAAAVLSLFAATLIYYYGETLKKETSDALKLLSIKRTPFIFNMLLNRTSPKNIIRDHALVFGNEKAHINIDTVISLDCSHCMKAVKEMCSLVERWPELICWRVYIDDIHNGKSNVIGNNRQVHIIDQYIKNRGQSLNILKKWIFADTKHPVSPEAQNLYEKQISYIRRMEIEHYPTILYNGHQLPSEYELSDITILMNDWTHGGTPA